ncbi:phosphatidylserine decarboxylase [Alkaliphilus pronyensis]|uniref:Phosphatidylserine decarboxylase n=1 Tax=Alkaliphilus pronyensis TaxID=1482732 RepID=A0A6I0F3K6_9FIRM|nr:phosphatidylserine decarboxylase [Alkaliphilus pronyensis]KAB3533475.1 phosphatidylserine decarboxylase [Alkaliphilus pronyensis]
MSYLKIFVYLFILINLILLLVYIFWRGFYFFRNPPRKIPADNSTIVSPADGKIVYVKEVKKGMCPISIKNHKEIPLTKYTKFNCLENKDYYLVGIYMSVVDVHYNRAPIAGKVKHQDYLPGFNVSMFSTMVNILLNRRPYERMGQYLLQNGRNLLWIEGMDISIGVVQIADIWISKIKSFVEEGKQLNKGEVLGLIRMGSQVDILLPADEVSLNCGVGERVKAGESVLAYKKP